MNSELRGAFVMPEDIQLVPVDELPEPLRKQLGGSEGDFALSRPRSRQTSKLISSETALLLEYFRTPHTIPMVVALYSRKHQIDPEKALEDVFPILKQVVAAGFLLPENADDVQQIQPSLKSNELFAGCRLLQCIQVMEDCELYLARASCGTFLALKLSRPGRQELFKPLLEREIAILKRLDGRVNPTLVELGDAGDRPYIALTWRAGIDAAAAAAEFRSSGDRDGMLQLLINIARAYVLLHQQGIIHCDVHPRNLLADRDGKISIIDFGMADSAGGDITPSPRGGVAFFHDPELAAALLKRRRLPRASALGEQYSVAALLYLLVTGHHYIEFNLEQEAVWRQIVEEAPLPFQERGLDPWPELEMVLSRAMAKKADERFPDMDAFVTALTGISAPTFDVPVFLHRESDKLIEEMLTYLRPEGKLFCEGLPSGPFCSVNLGMAGIAYALFRMAVARDEPNLLADADLWLGKAMRVKNRDEAFTNSVLDLTPATVGRISPYHSASGLYMVRALLAHGVGDLGELETAQIGFLDAINQSCQYRDLALGTCGVVFACALLLDALPKKDLQLAEMLRTVGNKGLDQVWAEVKDFDSIESGKDWPNLGIAHGWAGLLYVTLRWHEVAGAPLPESLERRLRELSAIARPLGRGLSWPWRSEGGGETIMSGWCNGSAGLVHLGCLAYQTLGEPAYLSLAEGAAWGTWEGDPGISDLCCGHAGRAYGLLRFYQLSGEPIWLQRARAVAYNAARAAPGQRCSEHPRHSFYKGELGLAVLLTEIERPDEAAMPLFGEELCV